MFIAKHNHPALMNSFDTRMLGSNKNFLSLNTFSNVTFMHTDFCQGLLRRWRGHWILNPGNL